MKTDDDDVYSLKPVSDISSNRFASCILYFSVWPGNNRTVNGGGVENKERCYPLVCSYQAQKSSLARKERIFFRARELLLSSGEM